MATMLLRAIMRQIFHEEGPRTDEAHISLENVQEFREFIQASAAHQRFLLDLWYVDHRSLWLDCKILLMTPWKVLKREGVMHSDDPSWEGDFKGTPSDRHSQ